MTCEICMFWINRRASGAAECRRFPPTVLIGAVISPLTDPGFWCGEFALDRVKSDAREGDVMADRVNPPLMVGFNDVTLAAARDAEMARLAQSRAATASPPQTRAKRRK